MFKLCYVGVNYQASIFETLLSFFKCNFLDKMACLKWSSNLTKDKAQIPLNSTEKNIYKRNISWLKKKMPTLETKSCNEDLNGQEYVILTNCSPVKKVRKKTKQD